MRQRIRLGTPIASYIFRKDAELTELLDIELVQNNNKNAELPTPFRSDGTVGLEHQSCGILNGSRMWLQLF